MLVLLMHSVNNAASNKVLSFLGLGMQFFVEGTRVEPEMD